MNILIYQIMLDFTLKTLIIPKYSKTMYTNIMHESNILFLKLFIG